MSADTVSFLPWLRTGLGNYVTDVAGARRPSVEVRLTVDQGGTPTELTKRVHMISAGDVLGVRPDVVSRVAPPPNSTELEPNYVPFIEFHDPDFPWRYTPEPTPSPSGPAPDRLTPWLALLVLDDREFEEVPSAEGLPAIRVPEALNWDPAQAATWAHVHAHADLDSITDLDDWAAANPERVFSRILGPRHLEAFRRYHAFLVPTYESGRLAGLGLDNHDVGATKLAWTAGETGVRLPVYFRWTFGTTDEADFETLARKLAAKPFEATYPAIDLGTLQRQLGLGDGDLSADRRSALAPPGPRPPWFGVGQPRWIKVPRDLPADGPVPEPTDDLLVEEEPGFVSVPGPHQAIKDELAAVVNVSAESASGDPYADTPPLYGRWHAGRSTVDPEPDLDDSTQVGWLEQVNLDPAMRAAAGLGADLVSAHQEDLVAKAWAQLGRVQEANRGLRQLQLSAEVQTRVTRKHLDRSPAQVTRALRPLHDEDLGGPALSTTIEGSRLPVAAVDAAMRTLTRSKAARNAVRRSSLDIESTLGGLADGTVSSAPFVNPGDVTPISPPNPPGPVLTPLIARLDNQDLGRAATESRPSLSYAATDAATRASLVSAPAFRPKADAEASTIGGVTAVQTPHLDPAGLPTTVMAAPVIDVPIHELLMARDPSLIVPRVKDMAANSATLLDVDQAFVEAVLVGMNHEMAAELLWREYPTDQRGTVFGRFWSWGSSGTSRDISPLHSWGPLSQLGDHAPPERTESSLLTIRAELVRAFPDVQVYARKALWEAPSSPGDSPRRLPDMSVAPKEPVFSARVGADILILGFDLSSDQLRGDRLDAGWFLVLRERPGLLRFGLDVGNADDANDASVVAVNDLSWHHFGAAAGAFFDTDHPRATARGLAVNAAAAAHDFVQVPMLVGLHASDLLGP